MAVTNFGGIEDTMHYLHWQLKAFAIADPLLREGRSANHVQERLDRERNIYFAKPPLFKATLDGIDTAFKAPSVETALGADKPAILAEWRTVRTTAAELAKRRNELAHSVLAISNLSPVRSMGLLANAKPIDPEIDQALVGAIGEFYSVIGTFIDKLTARLPFRDHNQVTFIS